MVPFNITKNEFGVILVGISMQTVKQMVTFSKLLLAVKLLCCIAVNLLLISKIFMMAVKLRITC